jgi:acyl-CoA dehydrogenase
MTAAEYAVLKRRNELRDIVIRVDDFPMDFGLSQRLPVVHKAAA